MALLLLASGWLLCDLYVSSYGPAIGGLGTICWIAGLLLLPSIWLYFVIRSLAGHRRLGWIGWLSPPAAYALAVLPPWSSWLFPMRVRAHRSELVAFAQSHATTPAHDWQSVNAVVAGLPIDSVFRTGKATVLCFSRNPEGESGLIYAPDGHLPEPPAWAKVHHATSIDAAWFWYGWHPD